MDKMGKVKSRLTWALVLAVISCFVPIVGGLVVAVVIYTAKGLIDAAANEANAEIEAIRADARKTAEEARVVAARTVEEANAAANQKMAEANAAAAHSVAQAQAAAQKYITDKEAYIGKLDEKAKALQDRAAALKAEIVALTKEVIVETASFSDLEHITSEEVKNKLVLLQNEEKDLLTARYKNSFKLDGVGSGKLVNDNVKQIIRCFNSECENLIASINYKNIDAVRGKINKSYEVLNRIFEVDGVGLPPQLLSLKLEEARLVYAYQEKKEQERQQQQAIKAQMIEEEKVRREIEKEKAKIDKEEKQFKGEVDKLMQYLQKTQNDVERNIYVDKIKELEEKIKLLEKDKENVLEREQNTRAGFVYIISNIGSFGEDVYKIGMTRRLEPMDRVRELGDASVPFEFDVHAMIFSEDAPALENTLHKTFRDKEVNKVNQRKEFFKVDLAEIEKVVKENHNATVTFTMVAEAKQYRESLKIAQGEA